jgi:uncharacterized protein
MPVYAIAIILGVGALAGILAGLLGVGGGIVVVPALRLLAAPLQLPTGHLMHIAVATSAAVILPTSLISARAHAKRGALDTELMWRWGPWMAAGSFCAALAGGRIASDALAIVFAAVAAVVGLHMARASSGFKLGDALPGIPMQWAIAGAVGVVSSWMGIGGGTLSVPILTLYQTPVHRAVGTGAALGVFIAAPALAGWIISGWGRIEGGYLGFVNLPLAALLLVPMVILAPFGAQLAHFLPAQRLKRLFGVFLIFTALALAGRTIAG